MSRRPGARSPSVETDLRDADELVSLSVEDVAKRLELKLGAPDDSTDALAREVLLTHSEPDALLDRLPLSVLAGLVDRASARCRETDGDLARRRSVWDLLDLVRRPVVLRRIPQAESSAWCARLLTAVEASDFTVGPLFRQRAERYGSKPLFLVPGPSGPRPRTWRLVASRVERLALALISLEPDGEAAPVAILSENRLEMALLDLACLTSGLVNVMVPANATEDDAAFILRHSKARTVVVSSRSQLEKVLRHREALPDLHHVISIDRPSAHVERVHHLETLALQAARRDPEELHRRSLRVRTDELATVMYTSGTTGMPKGIMFSHRNLVFKRFARAMALPEIGEDDMFLCFLPLFHTFGRFLEMLGCVFWGATYCFLENPSLEALVRGMRRVRPTVFISVPKKWMQLHDAIARRVDMLQSTDEELARATRHTTGGRLRWGLSAAGHLPAEVFRFFQSQGVQLMSGFGMTEATGGITMTPPDDYRDESLGRALPGIELRLAEDGELLVRGPYVMIGYLDPPEGESSFDEEGWFRSGDLMETDGDGQLRLVDRKKEIYKNVKGETIAPQRVENLFRDLESVGRAFLVGDHREYNTVLIYPNPGYAEQDFSTLPAEKVVDHFRSLVVTVNKFLAPFERIVDFALIDRDLDADRDELTPKGTPRRKIVARNFADLIEGLYRRANLQVGDTEIVLPNWLIQALGLTTRDIALGEDAIRLPARGTSLTVRRLDDRSTQIGACIYRHPPGPLNLGALLTSPRLWLGNEELVDFMPLEASERQRPGRTREGIEWDRRATPFKPEYADQEALLTSLRRSEWDLLDLDRAARMLVSSEPRAALDALRLLERVVAEHNTPLSESARMLLHRTVDSAFPEVRRRAFLILVVAERETRFHDMLERFLTADPSLLDAETREALCELDLSEDRVDGFVELAGRVGGMPVDDARTRTLALSLLQCLAAYGSSHPARYRRLRGHLVRMSVFATSEEVRRTAAAESVALREGFRRWLGPSSRLAVDPETGQEYRWDDVVVFDEGIEREDQERLLSVIRGTALLREGAFLFCRGVLISLSDIPPGGVWIRHLGTGHGKSVYRITIQTRYRGHFDLAVNVNRSLELEEVQQEIQWLILGGDAEGREPLVEEFGGYWAEHDLWSEEFITGETLDRALRRLSRRDRDRDRDRLPQLWRFLAWTALGAYVDFWERSGRLWEISDPSMANVVVPTDDYMTGVRIVSVSSRRRHCGLLQMMRSFMDDFLRPVAEQNPRLDGVVDWPIVFSSVLEVLGEEQGLAAFHEALTTTDLPQSPELVTALREFLGQVETRGFLPRRLFFAAERYNRWETLSTEATVQARAETLRELYETYGLRRLARDYPETRLRFFRETVFRDGPPALADGLDDLIRKVRSGDLVGDELIDGIADLRSRLDVGADEDYFLARISLPYLRPEDAADFVHSRMGGRAQSEIVVTLEDQEGRPFRVRHALNPKEVERLHRMFVAARLDVRFRSEHRYLVAIGERTQIIGGIYYEIEEDDRTAHLEKIVVSETFRRKGVADGLMRELFNRLRSAGMRTVTTGFFRPEYFYGYGFRIEKQYAGLVKSLDPAESDLDAPTRSERTPDL